MKKTLFILAAFMAYVMGVAQTFRNDAGSNALSSNRINVSSSMQKVVSSIRTANGCHVLETPSPLPVNLGNSEVLTVSPVETFPQNSPSTRADGKVCSVTPVLSADPENGIKAAMQQFAVPRNGRMSSTSYNMGESFMPFSLTPDTYDFIFIFDGDNVTYMVIKEGIEVDSDMEITADYSEATNYIECSFILPDGEEVQPPVYNYDTESSTPGNIVSGSLETLYYTKNGIFSLMKHRGYQSYIYNGESYTTSNLVRLYISPNDVMEIIWINEVGLSDGPTVLSTLWSPDCEPATLLNSTDGYVDLEANYGNALNSHEKDGIVWGTWGYQIQNNGRILFGVDTSTYDLNMKWDSSHVLYQKNYGGPMDVCPMLTHQMAYSEDYRSTFGIVGPIAVPTDSETIFDEDNNWGWYTVYEAAYGYNYTNPRMRYSIKTDTPQQIGATVPGVLLLRDGSGSVNCQFICRDGAVRTIDRLAAELEIKNNDEVLCTDFQKLNSYLYDDQYQPITFEGSWDFNITDSNMEIDGAPVLTSYKLHIEGDDENKSTLAIPQFQFRNTEEEMTELFSSIDEMTMLFECGRYYYYRRYDEELQGTSNSWESYEIQDITVEFAPRGTSDFVELPVQKLETPSDALLSAYTYSVSAKDIDKESANGWYDIRFTLKDGKDTLEQLISPAFCIDSTIGVKAINVNKEVYVLNGKIVMPAGARIYSVSGQRVSAEDAVSGMFIVVTENNTYKIVL